MNTLRARMKIFAVPLIAAMVLLQLPIGAAQGAMVGTDSIIVPQAEAPERSAADARAHVDSLLQREDVQAQLQQWGLSPEEARDRVAALSDAEIVALSGQLPDDPAGQGVVGAILIAAVVVAAILFITDVLGITNVYPFVKPAR